MKQKAQTVEMENMQHQSSSAFPQQNLEQGTLNRDNKSLGAYEMHRYALSLADLNQLNSEKIITIVTEITAL